MEKKYIQGSGKGKVILFGEHSVVYGYKALCVPLSQGCEALGSTVDSGGRYLISKSLNRKVGLEDKDDLSRAWKRMIEVTEEIRGLPQHFKIEVKSDLPLKAGLGSSASFTAAVAETLLKLAGISEPNQEMIFKVAFEGEKIFHGNPSGVDSIVSIYKRPVLFQKGEKPLFIDSKGNVKIVVVQVEEGGDTKAMVKKVAELREKDPIRVENILREINRIVMEGIISLERGDINTIARLFNKNHLLLKELGVSTPKIEEAREYLLSLGILGVKLTGAGGGGSIIGVIPYEWDKKEDNINQLKKRFNYVAITEI